MSGELIAAIADRISRGYTKESIAEEVIGIGYTEEQFEAAYIAATASAEVGPGLIGYGELLSHTGKLMVAERAVLFKATLLAAAVFVAVSLAIFLTASLAGIDSQTSFFLTAVVVPFIGLFIGFVTSLSLMRAIIERSEGQLFRQHLAFVARHFVPLMLVTLYLTIITQVGYALFFLPGIVATVYFLFATPLALKGDVRGFPALSASVALVHGRFLATLGRFLVLNIVVIVIAGLVFLLGGALFGVSLMFHSFGTFFLFPFVFVSILAVAIAAFFATTCGLVTLFESLLATKSAARPIKATSLEAFLKVVVGVVVVLLAIASFLLGFAGYALFSW